MLLDNKRLGRQGTHAGVTASVTIVKNNVLRKLQQLVDTPKAKCSDQDDVAFSNSPMAGYRNGWHSVVDPPHRGKGFKPHARPSTLTKRRLLAVGLAATLFILFTGLKRQPLAEVKSFAATYGTQVRSRVTLPTCWHCRHALA